MTLLDLLDQPEHKVTLTEATARYFKARPNQWIDARELFAVGGSFGWRTRISNCRKQFNLTIENRQRTVNGYTVSEYRLTSPT